MAKVVDVETIGRRKICSACVGEPFLSNVIQTQGLRGKCRYCKTLGKAISIKELAQHVSGAFERHYVRTSDQPDSIESAMLHNRELSYEWERHGEPVVDAISDAAQIPYEAAEDTQKVLEEENASAPSDYVGEEEEFDEGSFYEPRKLNDAAWQEEWQEFERSLKVESRYFNQAGLAHLKSVFANLVALRTHAGKSVIVDGGPRTQFAHFYRARYFEVDDKLKDAMKYPDRYVGPPPAPLARAGRMNAHGISVFYGASDAATALAEVRPPVGSRVVVAKFRVVRPLRLLDLRSFRDIHVDGSIFDPTLAPRMERAHFLRSLVQRISMPVMPSDEATEYLPTQAITDFLASNEDPVLDGILYPSVQVADKTSNVVLFHKAARVETIDFPPGSDVDAHTDDWEDDHYEPDYTVYENVPKVAAKKPTATELPSVVTWTEEGGADAEMRPVTLSVDLGNVAVHRVARVKFTTSRFAIKRIRSEKKFRKVMKEVEEEDPPF